MKVSAMTLGRYTYFNRAAFLAVTLLGVTLLYLVIFAPVADMLASQRNELQQSTSQVARLQNLVNQQGRISELAEKTRLGQQGQIFLTGGSEGAASADLQERIKQICARAGASVQSIQGLDVRDIGGIRYFGAHLAMSGPIAAIKTTLSSIEGELPYLFVDTLTVRAPAQPPGGTATQEAALDVQLDIYGATNVKSTTP